MEPHPIRVLLVGENAKGFSFLRQRLENGGCRCLFASGGSEAEQVARENQLDVVLCVGRVRGIEALVATLIGSPGSLYWSRVVDDGCLWLPAVLHGVKCLGAPAMRTSEFANALDGIIGEARVMEAHSPASKMSNPW
jgi:hypothetical protein